MEGYSCTWKEDARSNVFCGNCGITVLEEGFTIHDDGPYGIILIGKCKKCNGQVARYVESN